MRSDLTNTVCSAVGKTLPRQLIRAFSSKTFTVKLPEFKVHHTDPLPTTTEVTEEECLRIARNMVTMRRMEIESDPLYVMRKIRGFLHLYDGEEACGTGINEAIKPHDDWITSYRCHGIEFLRMGAGEAGVKAVINELLGHASGSAHGKGGSMHMYEPEKNFFGGSGIVGAQTPVGTGLAFAEQYLHMLHNRDKSVPEGETNICVTMFGDGASNQGQVWESANMAKLWHLPQIFVIENNQYGMGTSTERSSSSTEYYMMGKHHIAGIQADGNNVFAVREACRRAREICVAGNGPIFLELKTYRYHGHSMSDPGVTYRTRDEIQNVRQTRDSVNYIGHVMMENGIMDEKQWKDFQNAIKKEVKGWVNDCLKEAPPEESALFSDVFYGETPDFIRNIEYCESKSKTPLL